MTGVPSGKTGRNDPCPCGSGKKYKNCCLLRENSERGVPPFPPEFQAAIEAKTKAEQIRRERFGEGRPVIHADFQEHKFVAVGNELHYSRDWKTFPDFLQHYIRNVLGSDWGNAELVKPPEERHPIIKWHDVMCRFQRRQEMGPD